MRIAIWMCVTTVLASAGVATGQGVVQQPSSGTANLPASANSVVEQVKALASEVQAQGKVIDALLEQRAALNATKPARNQYPDTESGDKAYRAALKAWEEKVSALEKNIEKAVAKLDEFAKRLEVLAKKGLPASTAKDVAAIKETAARARARATRPAGFPVAPRPSSP
jgi:chromosome segregation ATPase